MNVCTSSLFSRLMCLLAALALSAEITAADRPAGPTRAQVMAFLEEGAGLMDRLDPDPDYDRTSQLIVEHGDEVLPILVEVLRTAADWRLAQQAAGVISGLHVTDRREKTRVLQAVMTGELPVEDPLNRIKTMILDGLPAWGAPEDVAWVLPSLRSPNFETQTAAIVAIGEIGDTAAGEAMMEILRELHAGLSLQEAAGDVMLREGETAVARIATRLAASNNSASGPPTELPANQPTSQAHATTPDVSTSGATGSAAGPPERRAYIVVGIAVLTMLAALGLLYRRKSR